MILDRDSLYAVVLRILQLIIASTSLILLCLRLQVYNLVDDTPPAVLTLAATASGLSILGSFIGVTAILLTKAWILACVVDVQLLLLSIGAAAVGRISNALSIQCSRSTVARRRAGAHDKCTVTDRSILAMVDMLRASHKERHACSERLVELRQCGDMSALCKRSRAVFFLQIGTIAALVVLLALEKWRRRRQSRPLKKVSRCASNPVSQSTDE